ncbi:MAG TPA: lysophospholipid acyltransferase family protein [Terriglobales bacterium]|nr:lysophospholipid acyltransferase family protein [Terriglobales bacterium]
MIRAIVMLGFWAIALPIAALITVPWALITGNVKPLYRIGMWGALTGVRLAGVRVKMIGRENLDPHATYIFMANHASNIDPPLLLPIIPGRSSVMARHELFNYPILGRAMRIASLVPVNRGNREAGIAAVRAAEQVVHQGIHMTIFVEGGRSFDGKLLPFKKGPFYLAETCQVPVVPVTISGTHDVMPKGRFAVKGGEVVVTFHDPIPISEFGNREELMEKVRAVINSGLPEQYRS